jgi:8-oxo-dGTP pyrophosphatase MutT (NUDIX family)
MKRSYGVGLCRLRNEPEILLCRRRSTYAFCDFMRGNYNPDDLQPLFDGMSNSEKIAISHQGFDELWRHLELSPGKGAAYASYKYKFKSIKSDHLRTAIKRSRRANQIWEIPKGRAISGEGDLDAAVREVEEEINVDPHEYDVIMDISPRQFRVTDNGVTYLSTYYIAHYDSDREFLYGDLQVYEVDSIRWWKLSELRDAKMDVCVEILELFAEYMSPVEL